MEKTLIKVPREKSEKIKVTTRKIVSSLDNLEMEGSNKLGGS